MIAADRPPSHLTKKGCYYEDRDLVITTLYNFIMAERVGFEPTVRCRITGFQDRLLKPLGHPSAKYYSRAEQRRTLFSRNSFLLMLFTPFLLLPLG